MKPLFVLLSFSALGFAQEIKVDVTPGHATNMFSPFRAMGSAVDGVPTGTVNQVYTPQNIGEMLSAGFRPLTYRLYTELSVQDWHWNPTGSFSAPGNQGYWTGTRTVGPAIVHSHGYNLPRRGSTTDQGNNSSYSRVDDGDPSTFWKSQPYLTSAFTGESDALHPQWIVIDLGARKPVNAIQLNWAEPFATDYQVQYWTGSDAVGNPSQGSWVTFPAGAITGGAGGAVTLTLTSAPASVEFIRVWMTSSSGSCVGGQSRDIRDCVGYALNEVGVGTTNQGVFTDLVNHIPNQSQTLIYCSSVDPWHTAKDIEAGEEQPGLDLIFTSGIARGIPPVLPVTMLYGTPEDSANQIAYLENKGYKIGFVELGEEPDGQYILPEDYAALYLQWSKAIHSVDPKLSLGGPVLSGDLEITTWPNAAGNTSWLNRFLNYLKSHNAMADLSFMSYEHYPYNPCTIKWTDLLQEPSYTRGSLATWAADGLPKTVPVFVTESNVSYDYQEQQVGLFGALWFSDFTGTFLTLGGKQVYFYEYEPLPLFSSSSCNSWGNFGMFEATNQSQVLGYTSQYFSAQMLTEQWVEPIDALHYVYPAESSIKAANGESLVTAYSVLRPDGLWSLMLINKDQTTAHAVSVKFFDEGPGINHYFSGTVTQVGFGEQQYTWHAANANGFPSPDGPIVTESVPGGQNAHYTLPPASITVLRGNIQ